jgi:hypothetical protein
MIESTPIGAQRKALKGVNHGGDRLVRARHHRGGDAP